MIFMKIIEIDKRSDFTEAHAAKTLLVLGRSPSGRGKIMELLGLNEASAKTLMSRFCKDGLAETGAKGHILTKKGRALYERVSSLIKGPYEINDKSLSISKYNVGYVVKKASKKIKKGLEQRDSAIRFGADGLITILFEEKHFVPSVRRNIKVDVKMEKGDVLLVGSAKTKTMAELAALNSAVELIE